jgi:hypothetical protein
MATKVQSAEFIFLESYHIPINAFVRAKKLATAFLHHVPFHHIVTSCCLAGRPSTLAPYLAAKHALHLAVYGAVRPARARDMLIHRFWKQCRHSFRKAGKPVTKTLAR